VVDNKLKIEVYLDDGRVFSYLVPNASKAREHSHAIVLSGYRHVAKGYFEHYPAHRILKVKVTGKIDTKYPDTVGGT
jgi:hypothetical protein